MQEVKRMCFLLVALAGSLCAFAKSGAQHTQDLIDCVFNSERSSVTKDLSDFISQGMDMGGGDKPLDFAKKGSSFLNTVRSDMGGSLKGFGSHRELGHWAFDGAIPKEYFAEIDELVKSGADIPPNAKEILVARWREFVGTRTEAVKQVFNLSGPNSDRAARSFASMMNDVHNLGDHTTKATKGLRSLDDITRNYLKSVNNILGNNNGLTQIIKDEVSQIPKNMPDDVRAAKIIEILKAHNEELYARIGNAFKRMGFDGALKPINYAKLEEYITAFRKEVVLRNAKQISKSGSMRCMAKEVTHGGKRIVVLEKPVIVENGKILPVEEYMSRSKSAAANAKRLFAGAGRKSVAKVAVVKGSGNLSKWLASAKGQGVTAGILTFVISEGSAVVAFTSGDIAKDQFVQKSVFNVGKGVADGLVTWGVSAAVASVGAPLWVSIGAAVGAGILVERGSEYLWVEFEKENGVLPGVTDDDLLYALPECVRNRTLWTNDVDSGKYQKQREKNKTLFDAVDDHSDHGESFY